MPRTGRDVGLASTGPANGSTTDVPAPAGVGGGVGVAEAAGAADADGVGRAGTGALVAVPPRAGWEWEGGDVDPGQLGLKLRPDRPRLRAVRAGPQPAIVEVDLHV